MLGEGDDEFLGMVERSHKSEFVFRPWITSQARRSSRRTSAIKDLPPQASSPKPPLPFGSLNRGPKRSRVRSAYEGGDVKQLHDKRHEMQSLAARETSPTKDQLLGRVTQGAGPEASYQSFSGAIPGSPRPPRPFPANVSSVTEVVGGGDATVLTSPLARSNRSLTRKPSLQRASSKMGSQKMTRGVITRYSSGRRADWNLIGAEDEEDEEDDDYDEDFESEEDVDEDGKLPAGEGRRGEERRGMPRRCSDPQSIDLRRVAIWPVCWSTRSYQTTTTSTPCLSIWCPTSRFNGLPVVDGKSH